LNAGTRIAVKDNVIDEEEYPYPQTAFQAFPWRFDSGCELVHEEHEGDRCNGGRPFGQRQSARAKQRSLPSGAGLLVLRLTTTTPERGRDPSIFPKSFLADIFSLSATLAI
jgi:hypothetical protein